jgi:8-hydroxy-5-deazaflavin:NADPH oxidoreductase
MNKRIGILGSGMVGQVLGGGFLKHGHEVMIGTNDPVKAEGLMAKFGSAMKVGTFEEAAQFGETLVLAVKGGAAERALEIAGKKNLAGKTIIDATNPIADAPPVNGVLQYFTGPNESLMERLQQAAPDAHFVKAFSCIGNAFMVNPDFNGPKPAMFICGNNAAAKAEVAQICVTFGHVPEDMGSVEAARAIEPLCILWCLPGFLNNSWSHAFALLKK